ncbi:fungal-specific transcription factor domain-containing protein [Aspergillus pseudoustus]|uniref:Fungal-specific transcription factor domain-containing protein n=1 Tax=Aspergillus pseudoustus TaxID=1810923 RepID=A0ABR4KZE2_9EURO
MASGKDKQLLNIAPGPGPLREFRPLTKNKKSSSACLPCKQAKRKCTGRPAPCKACENTQSDCIFDESKDLRRKLAAKQTTKDLAKTAEDLEYYRGVLKVLVRQLRTSSGENLEDVLTVVRKGRGDLDEVATNILQKFPHAIDTAFPEGSPADASDTSSEDLRSVESQESSPVPSHSRISIRELCEPTPLVKVDDCRPWTAVTQDKHLVSHLISVYFTWDHPLMQVVDQNMFLEHIEIGDTNSMFCSPMLVNSILAVASTYSHYPEVYGAPGDVYSRGQHFFREAEKQWKAQEGQPSLANIQALALMSHNLKLQGKDNASWLYLRQAVQLGQDIGIFRPPSSRPSEWDQMPEELKHASVRTAWGVFILNSHMSMESRRISNLEIPRLPLREMNGTESDTKWIPYPVQDHRDYPERPANLPYVMTKMVDLTEAVLDIQDLFFNKAFDMSIDKVWEEVDSLYRRLKDFLQSLPDTEIIDGQPIPQMLFLHIKCHQVIISLLGLLLEQRNSETSLDPSTIEQIKSDQVHAARQIANYLDLYSRHYELLHTPSLIFGPAKSSALTLLPFLNDGSASTAFTVLWKFLESFSRRFPAARDALFEIYSVLRDSPNPLPEEILAVVQRRDSEYS